MSKMLHLFGIYMVGVVLISRLNSQLLKYVAKLERGERNGISNAIIYYICNISINIHNTHTHTLMHMAY